jgi:hypothetical protein
MLVSKYSVLKNKILFWIDEGLIEFGIAKYLQNEKEFEMYCIYDIKYPLKESFKDQKIIQFKKEWFFWEHILRGEKEIDMDYLKSFEEKYGIEIWNLVYSERIFYKFNPFYKFKRKEILSIIEQECKFFEKILEEVKPEIIIIKVTDFHRNQLLHEMCKKKKIKILSLIPTRIGNRGTIASEVNKIEETNYIKNIHNNLKEEKWNLEKFLTKHNRTEQTKKIISGGINLSKMKKIKIGIKWIKEFDEHYLESYDRTGVTKIKAVKTLFYSIIKTKIRKSFIDKKFIKQIPNEKIIFFPLQTEPERNVSIEAPYYSDQIQVIINIAKSLPIEYKLYVKEHFSMRFRNWRKIKDYEKIRELPNVRLVHPSVSSKHIIEKSDLTITISSTAGLESIFYNKPTIVFSDTIYSSLSTVFRINGFENLPKTIKNALKSKVDNNEKENFVKKLERNSFEIDVWNVSGMILKKFHGEGFMINSKISMIELNKFIDKNKNIFYFLSNEYIKVIKKK